MLQHSRIRATYNIDGTAGGDCVQSYYCPCCTLMQDEREVLARERRIIRQQRGDGEVTEQPGFEPQMRYSTSNLLEEIPEIYRDHVNQGSYPNSTQDLFLGARGSQGSQGSGRRRSLEGMKGLNGGRDGRHGHEMDDLQPFSLGHSDADTSEFEDERRNSRSRRSSNSCGKLRVREISPLGSALNPITVSRSASLDHGLAKNKQPAANVPQRSVTSPTRRRSLKDTNPPAAKSTNYRLKSIITDERPDFLIETIREGSESSNCAMTTTSRTAVKSLGMDSLRSHTTKNTTHNRTSLDHGNHKEKKSSSDSQDEHLNDEAYTTFYDDKGKLVRRRISECLRPRASSPETPEIYALHHANPIDDEDTLELKTHLARQASIGRMEKDGQKRLLLKLKTPSTTIGPAQSLKNSKVAGGGMVPFASPTAAQQVHHNPDSLGLTSTSSSQYHTTCRHSRPSGILSFPDGVNDADDLASYLDQAVEDSGLQPKNQKSIDRSAMPVGAYTGNLPPRKQTLRLDFNSEDEGTDTFSRATTPMQKDIKTTFTVPSFSGYAGGKEEVTSPKSSVKHDRSTREAIEHYPSNIASSDGAGGLGPLETEPATLGDTEYDSGRHMEDTDFTKEFGELTPRHKKSVSDWFKDIGRSNSNKSDGDFVVKVKAGEVPPVPILPAQFKEGYNLGPLRSFSPLGFNGMLGSQKEKRGKSAFSTMGPNRMPSEKAIGTRTVSTPLPPAMELFKTPLADTTNNAEAIMETQDKLQVLQEEFKLMAEDIVYERNNQSPSPTPAAVGDNCRTDYMGPTSPLTLAVSTSFKLMDEKTPTELGRRSFPLVNNANATPKGGLSKATETSCFVSSGAVDIDHKHSRHGADIGNANDYDKKTLMSTIKEISATSVYGTDSPTTFALSLEGLDLPTNLETPSAIPEGFLEHMPGEFPITPALPTPVVIELEEVVVEANSPVKYFNRPMLDIPDRTVSLDAISTTSTTGSNTSTPTGNSKRPALHSAERASSMSGLSTTSTTGSNESTRPVTIYDKASFMTSATGSSESAISDGSGSSGSSGKSGHVHEDQEVEVANQFNPSSAAEAMNKTTAARVVSANKKSGRDSDPFSHPFFSGTAVMDFALINPRTMRQELEGSDEGGSEETIRPAAEVNPLFDHGIVATIEENPIHLDDAGMGFGVVPGTKAAVERDVLNGKVGVLNGDDITTLAPPPDHPTTTERMDDALAAITTKPRASSMHGALAKPVIESDELRTICDDINRGAVVYETSDDDEEIITVGPNGPITPKKRGDKNRKGRGSGVGRSDTVVRRSVSVATERGGDFVPAGNDRLQATLKEEVGGVPKVVMGESQDQLVITPIVSPPMSPPVMPAASPRRLHSPAEVMLRGMLGKVTAKVDAMAEQVKGDGRGAEAGGEANGGNGGANGTPKKKNSKNSPQRRRNRAEKKRREKAQELAGKL